MASLPSVVVGAGTIKLESDFRKHPSTSLSTEKTSSVSYQRSLPSTKLLGNSDPLCHEFQNALYMIGEGINIVPSLYVPILQGCKDKNSAADSQIIHAHIIKTAACRDSFLMTFLINAYGKCGVMEGAQKVFDKLPERNVVTWTALMTGYVHNLQPELAIRVFLEMLGAGVYPSNYTVGAVLTACSSLCYAELGKQIHALAIKNCVEYETIIGNFLCNLYSKCGNLDSVVKAFKAIGEKNVVSWTTVLSACSNYGQAEMGFSFFKQMLSVGVEPNEYTLISVLRSCCIIQAMGIGMQVHSLCIKLGYQSNLPITTSIMYLYLKCGWLSDARKLFDQMENISLITWNALIAGHAQLMNLAQDDLSMHCTGNEALKIFQKLNGFGVKPDPFTFSSILAICSSLVALEQGEQVHAQTVKTGDLLDVVVATALINMYSRCGSIEGASKAFMEMPTRTLVSWTSMITGFAKHGLSQQALKLFDEMRLAGVRPNKITFVGVLSACSQAGMVDEAMHYFEMMKTEYKIKPVMDHFACIIDMYVRMGKLDEAFDFVENMDIEPNEFIWSILIAGCRSHGRLDLGFSAAEQLLCLKPKRTETYVLLLSMYLLAERWKDVSKVRKVMKEEKVGKLRDYSWISFKDKVYSFKPDDNSHPQSERMYELLGDFLNKSKNLGYELQESLEVTDEEEKKAFISPVCHSEKLAMAFGLLNMPNCAVIRVIKSTGMCRHCHSFIRFVSLITNRVVIVRDSKRLHKFRDGCCSCGDYGSLL